MTRPLLRPAAAIWRGVVRLRTMRIGPTCTVRLVPSVRNSTRAGTCSDKPSRLAAYAPVGCKRNLSLPLSALTISSTEGHRVPSKVSVRGLSYRPRARRRRAPRSVRRCSALSTAARLPTLANSAGVNTEPGAARWIRRATAASTLAGTRRRAGEAEVSLVFMSEKYHVFRTGVEEDRRVDVAELV